MGAFADLTAYRAAVGGAVTERLPTNKGLPTAASLRLMSLWTSAPFAGAAPSTAVAPTRATTGALGQTNAGTEQKYLVRADLDVSASAVSTGQQTGPLLLVDRLSHQGGLSGIVTASQAVNLPTAALTRYTTGGGVWLAVEIYTAVGTTAGVITASYTNQAGTAGKTTQGVALGSTGFREAGRMILLPLADGDTGVRAVASVTLGLSTGTAGNFGITLFKPLAWLNLPGNLDQYQRHHLNGGIGGGVPEILDDACLSWLSIPTNTIGGAFHADLLFAEV